MIRLLFACIVLVVIESAEGTKGSKPSYEAPKPVVKSGLEEEPGPGNTTITATYFGCDFQELTERSLLYVVTWYMNNIKRYKTGYGINAVDSSIRLTEDKFVDHGFRMGSNISCSVCAFIKRESSPGDESPQSDNLFVGIKVWTSTLNLYWGNNAPKKIYVQPTVPIGCKSPPCAVSLTTYAPPNTADRTCTGIAFDNSVCGVKLHSQNYDNNSTIKVVTTDNGEYYKTGSFEIVLKTGDTKENKIWGNYALPPIKVTIIFDPHAKTVHEGKTCDSITDPHMKTFDGRSYKVQQAGTSGHYILYRNGNHNTEVQVRHGGNLGFKYNCGVAVKAGRDLFVAKRCDNEVFIGFKLCNDEALTVKSYGEWKYRHVDSNDERATANVSMCINPLYQRKYSGVHVLQMIEIQDTNGQREIAVMIFFTYGTYVEISINKRTTSLNINIIPSSHDGGAVYGLCGNLDGDNKNDFHYRPGEEKDENGAIKPNLNIGQPIHSDDSNQPTKFIEQWKVRSDAENLFSENVNKSIFTPWTVKACVCSEENQDDSAGANVKANVIPCNKNSVAECVGGNDVGTHTCSVYDTGRRRRSIRSNPVIPVVHLGKSFLGKRTVHDTTMTEDEAKQYCEDQIGSTSLFSLCSTVPSVNPNTSIDTCITDIMLVGTTEWTQDAKESMQDACLSELRRNTTLRKAEGVEPSIAKQIQDIACPSNCSSAGICVKGVCKCNDGYGTSDCSIDIREGPTISGLLDHGLCDEKDIPCDHAYVFGSIFADSGSLTCRLEEFVISSDGNMQQTGTYFVSGEFETFVETICPLHTTRRKRSLYSIGNDAFVTGYKISISNDGNAFGEGTELFIYDSTCQIMTNTSSTIYFTLQDGFCFLENACVPDGDIDPEDTCLKCDVDVDKMTWTALASTECLNLNPDNPENSDNDIEETDYVSKENTNDDDEGPNYMLVIAVAAGVLVGVVVGTVVVIKLTKNRQKGVPGSSVSLE